MPLDDEGHASALAVRAELASGGATPAWFRASLDRVARSQRDAWIDVVLDTGEIPPDGPDLPRGCVPYLPCSIETVVAALDRARVGPDDVFVDVGSGLGRTAMLAHLLTGAAAIGVEIQRDLVLASRERGARLRIAGLAFVHGDAISLGPRLVIGSVFFFYCPFGADDVHRVIDSLEPIARARPIRLCCVDVPLPERAWIERVSELPGGLTVGRSIVG